MTDGSDDYRASDDDVGASQEGKHFEEVLHEMLAIIANHDDKIRGSQEMR
jgi:hypothetical protein